MLSLIMDGRSRTTSTFDLQYVVNMQPGLREKKKKRKEKSSKPGFRTPASSIKVCKSAIRSGQSSQSELMGGEIHGRVTKGEERKVKEGKLNGFHCSWLPAKCSGTNTETKAELCFQVAYRGWERVPCPDGVCPSPGSPGIFPNLDRYERRGTAFISYIYSQSLWI